MPRFCASGGLADVEGQYRAKSHNPLTGRAKVLGFYTLVYCGRCWQTVALITEECLRRVQEASDIVALAESYGLKLRRSGSSFLAVCPFHNEKTPSFNINPQLQIFKCFGCGVGGGAFKFVQLMERCEFPEAVELLAQRAGIELAHEVDRSGRAGAGGNRSGADDSRKALRWANRLAFEYFRRCLEDEKEGRAAREYLLGRGFTPETIAAWGLGWAPDSWDGLLNFYLRELESRGGLHKRDKALKVGCEAGIFRFNEEKDRVYDAFRGRVMFPIFDNQQRPVGFGGRVLEEKPEAGGKYLNTSETPLFQKRGLLFGLNCAAKEIGLSRTAIVVEGYTDTIMCHQYGVRNVVATLGTSLTHEHVRLLRRYIQNEGKVVALFDSDNAGRKATERAVEIFMEEGVTLHVLQNLEVKDAGEYLPKYGAEAFQKFLTSAKDSFSYALERTLGQDFGGDLGRKAASVETLMTLVNRCPNAIRRQMMRRRVAEVAGVDEETLPLPEARALPDQAQAPGNRKGLKPTGDGSAALEAGKRTTVPVLLEARRQGRIRAEKRLLNYMFEDGKWSALVCDEYPPDEWLSHGAHEAAKLLRDAWLAGERPRLENILIKVVDEEVREFLIGLIDHGEGARLSEDELRDILNRLRVEELEERKAALVGRRHEAESAGDREEVGRLLVQTVGIDREIRKLRGL